MKYCTSSSSSKYIFFFFNDPAPTEIYPLSVHDALPISRAALEHARPCRDAALAGLELRDPRRHHQRSGEHPGERLPLVLLRLAQPVAVILLVALERLGDRKSTRLNSSHSQISYAVFCLK